MQAIGTEVGFRFTLERYQYGKGTWYEQRTGRGVVVSAEDYSVWPCPGYAVRVTSSPDYSEGDIVHLSPFSLVP